MRTVIVNELKELERAERVRIFYACESGSRAWGFPSKDSDYDVRFLYVRPIDWYLSVDVKRDVIERPINDALDLSGWDIKKALILFRKSNPPLLEWLNSPIVYLKQSNILNRLKRLMPDFYSPVSCLHHYLHMARGNAKDYLRGSRVKWKKYFYVLRPILACLWIERGLGVVPMEFSVLLDRLMKRGTVRRSIDELLIKKSAGVEMDEGPRIAPIHSFIEEELKRLDRKFFGKRARDPNIERLNNLFQFALKAAWNRN